MSGGFVVEFFKGGRNAMKLFLLGASFYLSSLLVGVSALYSKDNTALARTKTLQLVNIVKTPLLSLLR